MLDHCTYDTVKLLHELSSILWFIKKHGEQDAQNAGDQECRQLFESIAQDLDKHINALQKCLCKKC